ncbi:MAG TPA: hypothetical protein VK629_12670 [Steroidobacteraceae bacterium]|nr:hypothetical protein [Steroidobacteraceae bacterium]
MEELKQIEELTRLDESHILIGQLTGWVPDLGRLHAHVSSITLHSGVPEEIRGQFNVARNMALYQYYFYALAPEVQLKTYAVIEYALRLRAGPGCNGQTLHPLVKMAVSEGWISDAGFRNVADPQLDNRYCQTLLKVMNKLRNGLAHGSNQLTPNCIGHLEICADFVNQLFKRPDSLTD